MAVIRLSGPDAVATAQHVFVPSSRQQQSVHMQEPWQPESHRVYHGRAVGPDGAVLDEVCVSDVSTRPVAERLLGMCLLCNPGKVFAPWKPPQQQPSCRPLSQLPVCFRTVAQVLALAMLAPRSFTAENVVEVHTHGGAVPARRVLDALLAAGARLARPGEFTLRAFLNGRLDLTQVAAASQTPTTIL